MELHNLISKETKVKILRFNDKYGIYIDLEKENIKYDLLPVKQPLSRSNLSYVARELTLSMRDIVQDVIGECDLSDADLGKLAKEKLGKYQPVYKFSRYKLYRSNEYVQYRTPINLIRIYKILELDKVE